MILGLLALLLVASGVFSGSETGFYALSRLRIAAEARSGGWTARLIDRLIRHPAGFLITLLVGNNLCLELLTLLTQRGVSRWEGLPAGGTELLTTALLTPVVFLVGELFPKDVFRRRPRVLYGLVAPFLALARIVLWPVVRPLQALSTALEHLTGVRARDLEAALARERVVEILREGARTGALAPRAQELALNVFEFRTKSVREVMIPWTAVETVDADRAAEDERRQVAASSFSRLPLVGTVEGRRVVRGYLHQLDLLADAVENPAPRPPDGLARQMLAVPEELTVDRALGRMRAAGQRIALVGTPAEPVGIVTLKDLVQTISGELAGW